MKLQIHNRHLRITENLENLIERQSRKVRKLLPTFSDRDIDLHVQLERLAKAKQFHTVVVLTLPQKSIRVEDIEGNIASSTLRAFEELIRRIKRFKSRLTREQYWRRDTPIAEAVMPAEHEPSLDEAIRENIDKLENYVHREVFHEAVVQGLPPGTIEPHAVVDEVFVHVRNNPEAKPSGLPPEQWFFKLARQVLKDQIESYRRSSNQPHLQDAADSSAGPEDERLLDFYQPDEPLRLEDLLQDAKAATPEEYLAGEETENRLQSAIARLPQPERDVFILFALEGFNSDEVAMITGKSPAAVLEEVKRSRQLLRDSLETMEGRPV